MHGQIDVGPIATCAGIPSLHYSLIRSSSSMIIVGYIKGHNLSV